MCEAKYKDSRQIRHNPEFPQVVLAGNPAPRRRTNKSNNYMGFWWTSCLTVLGTAIMVAWIPNLLSPGPPKGNVDGYFALQLKKVAEIFRLHLLSEEEKGAALSIFKDGELVVDMWGGYADIEAWQPWKQSTVANTFSLYNVAVSLSLGLLYERQLIDYDKPVAYYWPQFAQAFKEKVTVRELLAEQAGLMRLNRSISLYNMTDNDHLSSNLAFQSTSPQGYFAMDGDQAVLELYADQLVRLTDPQHRSLKQFFEEEFANKSNLDFYVGLPQTEQHRAARVRGHGFSVVFEILFAPIELLSTLVAYTKSTTFTEINSVTRLNDPGIRSTSVGSVSGFSSARALAQLYNDALLLGQNNKSTSISKETWTKISQPVIKLDSNNFAVQLGLISNWTKSAAGQVRTSPKGTLLVGYSGFGGQYAYVDRERNISIAYLTNYNSIYRSALDPRFKSLLRALYDSI